MFPFNIPLCPRNSLAESFNHASRQGSRYLGASADSSDIAESKTGLQEKLRSFYFHPSFPCFEIQEVKNSEPPFPSLFQPDIAFHKWHLLFIGLIFHFV